LLPEDLPAAFELAVQLAALFQLDEAIQLMERVVSARPDWAEAHCHLGRMLVDSGRYEDGLASLRRGHELGTANGNAAWKLPSREWIEDGRRLARLERQLPEAQRNDELPADVATLTSLGWVALRMQEPVTAAGFYATVTEELNQQVPDAIWPGVRLEAMRAFGLAAVGTPPQAATLDVEQRRDWSAKARELFNEEITDLEKQVASGHAEPAALRRHLQVLRNAPGLTQLRQAVAGQVRLPAAERDAWSALWARADRLLAKLD
jgi:tetratricopeptide (TPR) repeat protein